MITIPSEPLLLRNDPGVSQGSRHSGVITLFPENLWLDGWAIQLI